MGRFTETYCLFSSFSLFLLFSFTNAAAFELATIPFHDGFTYLWGEENVVPSIDGNSVKLILDKHSGSGFKSIDIYGTGFVGAEIKLPSKNYTAGVCVTFYTTNGDVFENRHDEIDFEFLGNTAGKPWQFQTNLFGNGTSGREERYNLWYDPTKEYHRYSILWTETNIIYYIDEIPIREVLKEKMGSEYPSKPMYLYATIWDASKWATDGGKQKVDYNHAPFVAQYKDLVLKGCTFDPIHVSDDEFCSENLKAQDYAVMTALRRLKMRNFRKRFMHYSYCYDTIRYSVPPPECNIILEEKQIFNKNGNLKSGGSHRRHSRRGRRSIPMNDMIF